MNRTFVYPITSIVLANTFFPNNSLPQARNTLSVNAFLKSQGFSSRNLIQLKKTAGNVLLNETPVFLNHPLKEGDVLTIHYIEDDISENIVPVNMSLNIIYEDEDLMVINKPAGMPIHPSMNHYDNSLANGLAYYFAEQNLPFVFRCINRLDRDTSGLTIIAKHSIAAGILSAMVAAKHNDCPVNLSTTVATNQAKNSETASLPCITREYLAIVRGHLTPESGTITAPIARKGDSIIEREVNFETGEHAVTHYRLLDEKNGHSLVSLHLETGRTHQIRIHLKHIGFPIIGDYLYNPDNEYISRQALHSHKLTFVHPITHESMEFTAPLPPDMQAALTEE